MQTSQNTLLPQLHILALVDIGSRTFELDNIEISDVDKIVTTADLWLLQNRSVVYPLCR